MVFLVADIVSHGCIVSAADCKRSIAVLPLEGPSMRKRLVNPSGRVAFDGSDELRDRNRGRGLNVQVNMITNPTRAEQPPVLSLDCRCRAGKQPGPPFRVQPGPAILGGPDEVNAEGQMGVRHRGYDAITGAGAREDHAHAPWCQIPPPRPMFPRAAACRSR